MPKVYRNRRDHHDFLGIVFEDKAHIEVLQLKLDSLKVDQLDILKSNNHRRLKQVYDN
jgi:hypothetical protein